MSRSKQIVFDILELNKIRITWFVAVSTIVGYVLASGGINFSVLFPVVGVFLIACGASALNHYQERDTDALMARTKSRPLPSGRMKPSMAIVILVSEIITGLTVLYIFSGITSALLGVLAVFWYNGFYTPLKKKSVMAVVPGSLIGSIPPTIGWVAGGGYIFDPELYALAMFFFIWQIPHFWLLLLIFGKDYEQAGMPSLTQVFSPAQLSRITFMWILALVASCLIIPLFGVVESVIINTLLILAGIWLIYKSRKLLGNYYERITFRFAFREINNYVLYVIILLSINKIFNIF